MSDMEALEPWLSGIAARIEPRRRTMLGRKIGQNLRKTNAQRVLANLEPDGSAMAPRNPKKERARRKGKRGRPRGGKGRMFRRIELARNMVIRTSAEEVSLGFNGRVAGTAAVHHYGLEDVVDRRIRNSIRVRYKARRLLGFGPGDREAMLVEIMGWLEGR